MMSISPQIRNAFSLARVAHRAPSIRPLLPTQSPRTSLIPHRRLPTEARLFSNTPRSANASPSPRWNVKSERDEKFAKLEEEIRDNEAEFYNFLRNRGFSEERARKYVLGRKIAAYAVAWAILIGGAWAVFAWLKRSWVGPSESTGVQGKKGGEVWVEVKIVDTKGGAN
jgi:hypothetical protein